MQIKTARLLITELEEAMAESVHRQSLDPDNRRFVPDEVFETVDAARETISYLVGCYRNALGPFVYAVLLENGEHIGHVQAARTDRGWELGYHIGKQHTNKGYSTEAVRAFLPFIVEKLGVASLYGICLEENAASIRVLEKCGFTLDFAGLSGYQGKQKPIRVYKYAVADETANSIGLSGETSIGTKKMLWINN